MEQTPQSFVQDLMLGEPQTPITCEHVVAMLLPPAAAGEIISGSGNGTYTLPGFWNTHVDPGLTSPLAAVQADWLPL